MRVVLLVNPTARAGSGTAAVAAAVDRLRAASAEVHVLTPADAGEMRRRLEDAVRERPDGILVAGGDGTVALALNALAGTGVRLGIVPTGTGNDLARDLGLPDLDGSAAADAVLGGVTREIDLARVTRGDGSTAFFGTVLASGFDARVNDRTNRMRWPRGRARYTVALLQEFLALTTTPYVLDVEQADGTHVHLADHLIIAAVGNTRSYGGGVPICPDARLDDGLLDVTVARAAGRARLLALLPRVYAGRHTTAREVTTYRVRAITLTSPGVTAYADGEPVGALPLRVDCAPRAVTVFTAG